MAYTADTNTRIVTFINRAQTKIGVISTFVAKRLGKRVELYKTELDTAFLLDCFVRAMDNNFNNWTEQEIDQCLDYWNAKANLSALPYFEHEQYNFRIVFLNSLGGAEATINNNISLNGYTITNISAGINPGDAVNKAQLDTKVSKSGDSMTGDLAMGTHKVTGLGAATANGEAVRYEQLQAEITDRAADEAALQANIDTKVSKSGDSMTGDLAMGTHKVTGLAAASTNGEAVRYEQLTTETAARIAADGVLQAQITALAIFPTGGIVMWAGTSAPTGWALCDGSGGTPDLRSKFIVGYNSGDADYSTIGNTGGAKTVTLGIGEIPSHVHSVTRVADGSAHSFDTGTNWSTYLAGGPTDTAAAGGGGAHENRPPFYCLAFIIKL